MAFLLALAVALWFMFGSPMKNIADWFWDDDPAPWGSVDAFYYPDRADLSVSREMLGLSSLDDCCAWVASVSAGSHDLGLTRGDYECGVGRSGSMGDLKVYRRTVK